MLFYILIVVFCICLLILLFFLHCLFCNLLKQIRPKQVMIYTIDRETPVKALKKATKEELDAIAERARKEGFDVTVSY